MPSQVVPQARRDSVAWRRASFCHAGECVEVAGHDGMVWIRSSSEPELGTIRYSPAEFAAFVAGVKAGEFDELTR